MEAKRNRPILYVGEDDRPPNYFARLMRYVERSSLDERTTTDQGGCYDDHR